LGLLKAGFVIGFAPNKISAKLRVRKPMNEALIARNLISKVVLSLRERHYLMT
jgi:hypothetical protein